MLAHARIQLIGLRGPGQDVGPATARSLVVACSFCRRFGPQGRRPWGTGGVAAGPGCFCRGVGGKLVKKEVSQMDRIPYTGVDVSVASL